MVTLRKINVTENIKIDEVPKQNAKRKLIIVGDSMLKHISVTKLLPDSDESINLCQPGSKVEDLKQFTK